MLFSYFFLPYKNKFYNVMFCLKDLTWITRMTGMTGKTKMTEITRMTEVIEERI